MVYAVDSSFHYDVIDHETHTILPRPKGATLQEDAYGHWILSQLAGGRRDDTTRPQWADPQAGPSSWTGGMVVSHVVAGETLCLC